MSEAAKQQKQIIIDEIKAKLDGAQAAVLIDLLHDPVGDHANNKPYDILKQSARGGHADIEFLTCFD